MRNSRWMVLVAVLLLTLPGAGLGHAQTPGPFRIYLPLIHRPPTPVATLTAVADAYVAESYPEDNTGHVSYLLAGYDEDPETMEGTVHSLIHFDLSGLQSHVIGSATLRLYYTGFSDYEDMARLIEVFAADGPWQETEVTWLNQPPMAEPYGSISILSDDQYGYREIDVTTLVEAWVDGSVANHGIFLLGPEESGSDYSYRVFRSRETVSPPQLVISFR